SAVWTIRLSEGDWLAAARAFVRHIHFLIHFRSYHFVVAVWITKGAQSNDAQNRRDYETKPSWRRRCEDALFCESVFSDSSRRICGNHLRISGRRSEGRETSNPRGNLGGLAGDGGRDRRSKQEVSCRKGSKAQGGLSRGLSNGSLARLQTPPKWCAGHGGDH